MARKKLPPLLRGDVIKTHPRDGYWGCAVVLNMRDRCERFNPSVLIGITPTVFRYDYAWSNVADIAFSILESDGGIPGPCVGWYDARPHPSLPTMGRVDASRVFPGPIDFDTWPLCGRISTNLGSEAVFAWRKKHDAEQLAIDLEAARKSQDEIVARIRMEEKQKREARKRKKRTQSLPHESQSQFQFHPDLFECRTQLMEKLASHGYQWMSHYSAVDLRHAEYGLEVCGIPKQEDALAIRKILRQMFPQWRNTEMHYRDEARERGWKIIIQKNSEGASGAGVYGSF
jgi:hypothetical protein